MRFFHALLWTTVLTTMMAGTAPARADVARPGLILDAEWQSYKASFLTEEGRIVDDANGNISHSEGQGYGMMLAHMAGDAAAFDAVWQFTRTELMIRGDNLAAWRWEPDQTPRVTDANNASDGDILIAYALALEGEERGDATLISAARDIADAVGAKNTLRWRGMDLLLPAEFGFRREDRADGPVVNPSYWVFEAFPVLAQIAPHTDWERMAMDGRRLLMEARFGDAALPTDWVALPEVKPVPAEGFDPWFGYNSVRIPLYLLRAGHTQQALIGPYLDSFATEPAVIDLPSGDRVEALVEPGYRAIGAALLCVSSGIGIPEDLKTFSTQSYYGSTLHLLTLSYLRASAPDCM